MRYTGIQPQYLPRLHYFARIFNSDIFMVRDDAQFLRKHKYPGDRVDKSYQAHTPIKQAHGIQLLSIPTVHAGFLPICQTQISYNNNWTADHLKAIQLAYSKAPNFLIYFEQIQYLLTKKYSDIAELNLATIYWGIVSVLNISKFAESILNIDNLNSILQKQKIFRLKQIKRASQSVALKKDKNLTANEKIIAACKELKVNEDYCGGTGVTAYVDKEYFQKNGIKITVQDWYCRTYPQLFPKVNFIKDLSIIDLLMNVSPREAARILQE